MRADVTTGCPGRGAPSGEAVFGGEPNLEDSRPEADPQVDRGRRRYLLTCLALGFLKPETVAKAVERELRGGRP